jgi:hypothetical protein
MDRLSSMITFVKVVEAGGFAAAGRKLGISPSTVTQQIQALEERLGARLLNRSTEPLQCQKDQQISLPIGVGTPRGSQGAKFAASDQLAPLSSLTTRT